MFCYGYIIVSPMYIADIVLSPIYTADIGDSPILTAILISLVVCILYILTCFTYYLLILQS
jgi:hypothetical protein